MNRILAFALGLGLAAGASAQSNDARVEAMNGSSSNAVAIDQAGTLNTVGEAAGDPGVFIDWSNGNDIDIDQVGASNSATAEVGGRVGFPPVGAWAASNANVIKIDQDGSGNDASVQTVNDSDGNDVDVRQDGDDNASTVATFNSARNFAEVDQDGDDNTAIARLTNGSDRNDFQVDQDGIDNRALIEIANDSDRNGAGGGLFDTFRIKQDGDDHVATMRIDGGDRNGFDIDQRGVLGGHTIDGDANMFSADGITVTGNQNWTEVDQRGTSQSFSESIVGNGNTVDVFQND